MSYQYPDSNYQHVAPPKKSNAILIILGVLAGAGVLVAALCCGAGLWLASFPGVSTTASEPFEIASVPVPAFPEATPLKTLPGLGECRQVVFGDGTGYGTPPGTNSQLWIYKPTGTHAPKSLPCVLICGAGSTMLKGMALSEGDEPEHLPYLKAGFVVVAYELDGHSDQQEPDQRSYEAFRQARAGLVNARNAMEYALHKIPEVNPNQIFAAGHSSAGTMALLFAEHDDRLAGCVAYAPCSDLKEHFPGIAVRALSSILSGLPDFIVQSSPRTHEAQIECPVMVFQAADDSLVPVQMSRDFVQRLQGLGKDATLVEVPDGEHYDSMIQSGIPSGIDWIKKRIHSR